MRTFFLASADPGSSDKGWAVASSTPGTPSVEIRAYAIDQLPEFCADLCARAETARVILSLDAPIRAFGGVQEPPTLDPAGASRHSGDWPFDVNPFSQRPCEHALSSRPSAASERLNFSALAEALAILCDWSGDFGKSPNAPFVAQHPGVSVLGYQGAPHAPVVGTFLTHLAAVAAASGLPALDFDLALESGRGISVVETHPAVALAFYAKESGSGLPGSIPKYKPLSAHRGEFGSLALAFCKFLEARHSTTVSSPLAHDDALDALIGLTNLLDLATGQGDVFGTVEAGYFLVPKRAAAPQWRDLWRAAADGLIATGTGSSPVR